MSKKYELTSETKNIPGRTLHRIKALKDFGDVKAGDLGGWVEKEENLSQEGTCWVYNEAKVYDDAKVFDNVIVFDTAEIYGNARACDNARIYDNVYVFDNAVVYGNARVFNDVWVFDNARVCGDSYVFNNAKIRGNAVVRDRTVVSGNAKIFTALAKTTDYLCLGPIGSRNDYITFTKSDNEIYVATGCFSGTLEAFKGAVKKKHGVSIHAVHYNTTIAYISNYFNAIHTVI